MAEQSPAIAIAHPQAALTRLFNPVLMLLLHTPFLGAGRKQFMTVSFTGRKTVRHFSIPLSAHMVDGILYALATMRGELIEDTALIADIYSRLTQSYGAKRAGRSMGLAFRGDELPSRDDFAEAVERLHLRAIRFTPAT